MEWLESVKRPKIKTLKKDKNSATPDGYWVKCKGCSEIIQTSKLKANFQVCPYCQHHYRMRAHDRISLLVDEGSFEVVGEDLRSNNPLQFFDKKSYEDRLNEAIEKNHVTDTTICGKGLIDKNPVALAVMDFHFMGGSMGVVTGEKIAMAFEISLKEKIPAVVVAASGGARMQEGIVSLMQLAKTSALRKKLEDAKLPYIVVLTDPTTGGCAASFATQGDITLAEPKALIGFAGPRVIEQSIRQKLPQGFQSSEFLLEHGFVDNIVHRHKLKEELAFYLNFLSNNS